VTAEELVAGYSDRVYTLAYRLTGNAADAQDLTQDSLIRAIRGLDKFRGDADPGTWIYRITVNTWKNRVRSEKRRFFWKTVSLDAPAPDEDEDHGARLLPDGSPALDREMEQDEAKQAVEVALSGLDPEDKAILVLRDLEDRSYDDIAGILELPVGTVKSRLSRAREALRARLRPYMEGQRHDA
jgi:RNA polymerase sigma-70 factor (ECF subfamily)